MIKYPYTDFHEMNLDWLLDEMKKTAERVDSVEKLVDELKQTIDIRLNDEALHNAAEKAIDEMAESGALAAMLHSYVDPAFTFARVFRIQSNKDIARYNQGLCWTGSSFIVSGVGNGGVTPQYFAEVDTSGNIKNSHVFSNNEGLGHVGSLAFLDNVVYCANGNNGTVGRINYNTWEFIDNKSLLQGGERSTSGLCTYNDSVYVANVLEDLQTIRVYTIDSWDETELTYVCTFRVPGHAHTDTPRLYRQGFAIVDGFIYFSFSDKQQILKVELTTGKVVEFINLPLGDGFYPIGEIEDLTNVNGQLFFASQWVRSNTNLWQYQYCNIFKTSIGGVVASYGVDNVRNEKLSLVVDSSINSNNPDGTIAEPFTCTDEACIVYEYLQKVTIPGTYTGITLANTSGNNSSILLDGVSCVITGNNQNVKNIYLSDGVYRVNQVVQTVDSVYTRFVNTNTTLHQVTLRGDCSFIGGTLVLSLYAGPMRLERCAVFCDDDSYKNLYVTAALQSNLYGYSAETIGAVMAAGANSTDFTIATAALAVDRLKTTRYAKIHYSLNQIRQTTEIAINSNQVTNLLNNNTAFTVTQKVLVNDGNNIGYVDLTINFKSASGEKMIVSFTRGSDTMSGNLAVNDMTIVI